MDEMSCALPRSPKYGNRGNIHRLKFLSQKILLVVNFTQMKVVQLCILTVLRVRGIQSVEVYI